MSDQELRARIKRLIVQSLNLEGMTPEKIGDLDPLFGEGLGLDSVDALELVVAMEKEFAITIHGHEVDRMVFASVTSLAEFVEKSLAEARSGSPHGQ
jgi:acyl carrier protein